MSRYTDTIVLMFFFLLLIIIGYVSCELPSTQVTTMNNLRKALQNSNNSNWNSSANPCSWIGVSCTTPNESFITALFLSSLSISSVNEDPSCSSLVCEIQSLQSLDLSNNHLDSIPLPFFSCFGDLKVFNFSNNRFNGTLTSFQGFGSLVVLDLSHNLFDGVSIDSQFDGLNKLKSLNLSDNKFIGSIPTKLGSSMLLEELQLSNNSFDGVIPDQITRCCNFSYLDLSYNRLSGSIPSDLLSQPSLLTIDLTSNILEGVIPSIVSTSLVRLRLASNRLIGKMPLWSFGNVVPSLTYLEVDHNKLSGMIPTRLRLCRNLSLLDLSNNNLVGFVPPQLGDLNKLQVVQLQHNNLYGEIPNQISGLQMLETLNMSWNILNGSIPPSLSRLNKLAILDLQANNLSGEFPDSFSTMDSLLELQLGSNHLGGVVRSLPTKLQIALNLSTTNLKDLYPLFFKDYKH